MLQTSGEQIAVIVYALVCGLAVWRGGPSERFAGATIAVNAVANVLLQDREDWLSPQWGLLAIDAALLAALIGLALRSSRSWTAFAAAFMLLAVLCHLVVALDLRIMAWAYLTGTILFGYAVLAALLWGTMTEIARRRGRRKAMEVGGGAALTGLVVTFATAANVATPQAPERHVASSSERVQFVNCKAARDAGAASVRQTDPRYGPHLDRDRDGVGCE